MYNFKTTVGDKSIKAYGIAVCALSLISVGLAILDLVQGLSRAVRWIDNGIYLLFVTDYAVRFLLADEKGMFFKANLIDLIAIVPLNSAFRGLRLVRMTKLLKLTKLVRIGALSARSASKMREFLNTNGFKYVICLSVFAVVASSCAMVYFEGIKLPDAVWWSFVTATTVGYGDLSPATAPGRIIASLLMLIGIGLIGSLTSTITSFFLKDSSEGSPAGSCSMEKVDMALTLYEKLSAEEKALFQSRAGGPRKQR